MEYGGIHDPEVNLDSLLNEPGGDPGSGPTKLRCNRKSIEPRESGHLISSPDHATNLSHNPGQVTSPFLSLSSSSRF